MQRACALLLVSFFSAWLAVPVWVSEPANQLPECCRRAGRHKCEMLRASAATELTIAARCPFANVTRAEAVLRTSWLPGPEHICFGELLACAAVHPQTEARHRASLPRAHLKRGPPSSFFPS